MFPNVALNIFMSSVSVMMGPKRSFRFNSPFSTEQCAFVIFEYGRLQSLKLVQREFRKKYFPKNPREVPRLMAFHRLVERFKKDAAVRPKVTPGPPGTSAEDVQRVKSFFQRKKKAHIRQAVQELNLSFCKIWKILRKVLKWKAVLVSAGRGQLPCDQGLLGLHQVKVW